MERGKRNNLSVPVSNSNPYRYGYVYAHPYSNPVKYAYRNPKRHAVRNVHAYTYCHGDVHAYTNCDIDTHRNSYHYPDALRYRYGYSGRNPVRSDWVACCVSVRNAVLHSMES
jgi:hypothetical protein